jgi:integrase
VHPARAILKALPRLLREASSQERPAPKRAISAPPAAHPRHRDLPTRYIDRLLKRLDCDRHGNSKRTKKPAWESLALASATVGEVSGDWWMALALACWLERHAPTTRLTYAKNIAIAWRFARVTTIEEAVDLPIEAAMAWQRDLKRSPTRTGEPRRPRTINNHVAVLNSWGRFCTQMGLRSQPWTTLQQVVISSGRHIDRDPVVLTADQLAQFWTAAARLPRRRFLALLLDSLHGLRRSEVARLRWADLRIRRRGAHAQPATFVIRGKGGRVRQVRVHPALRPWLERARRGMPSDAPMLADAAGQAPTPEQISAWAKSVFRLIGIPEGYAHALRATWATLALEANHAPLQVQQSGGWRRAETMIGHYFKRRQVPLIDPIPQEAAR